VFWVEADQGLERLLTIVSRYAASKLDGKASPRDQLTELWRGLNRPPASLVVLDNFPETDKLQPWLPPAGPVHVLVTTRGGIWDAARWS